MFFSVYQYSFFSLNILILLTLNDILLIIFNKKTDSENPRGVGVNEAAIDNITKPLAMVERRTVHDNWRGREHPQTQEKCELQIHEHAKTVY